MALWRVRCLDCGAEFGYGEGHACKKWSSGVERVDAPSVDEGSRFKGYRGHAGPGLTTDEVMGLTRDVVKGSDLISVSDSGVRPPAAGSGPVPPALDTASAAEAPAAGSGSPTKKGGLRSDPDAMRAYKADKERARRARKAAVKP